MSRVCPHCRFNNLLPLKAGHFVRGSDKKRLQRYRCRKCSKSFSAATFQLCYRQNKRRLNATIDQLLNSGMSQRRIAKILKINRKTVARKLVFLGHRRRIENRKQFLQGETVYQMQFDDLETIEHTKCKPLSVTMAVEAHTRRILGFRVSQMPAKGLLTALSRKKYGFRADHRAANRRSLFEELSEKIHPRCEITSDESPHYPRDVKKYFPEALHIQTPGKRGCVTGQGELKRVGFDPLFSLNHTFAMLRANINRLIRKTWCTTKCPKRLEAHIEIYVYYHNNCII